MFSKIYKWVNYRRWHGACTGSKAVNKVLPLENHLTSLVANYICGSYLQCSYLLLLIVDTTR